MKRERTSIFDKRRSSWLDSQCQHCPPNQFELSCSGCPQCSPQVLLISSWIWTSFQACFVKVSPYLFIDVNMSHCHYFDGLRKEIYSRSSHCGAPYETQKSKQTLQNLETKLLKQPETPTKSDNQSPLEKLEFLISERAVSTPWTLCCARLMKINTSADVRAFSVP